MGSLDWMRLTKKYTAHGVAMPIALRSAKGAWVEDTEGKRYLDLSSGYGVAGLGWNDIELLRVHQETSGRAAYGIPWLPQPEAVTLAEKLVETCGIPAARCVRATGGGDANEVVLRAVLSKHPTAEFLAFRHAYHGGTAGSQALSDAETFHFAPIPGGIAVHRIDPPHCFRCPLGLGRADCGLACAGKIREFLDRRPAIRAFFFEPILGSGGIIAPPRGYWSEIARDCRDRGVMLIADEVLTGLGRTGAFLACDDEGVRPDALTLGKCLGGGVAGIGAAVLSGELADALQDGHPDTSATFAWMPPAAAVASRVIDRVAKEPLLSAVRETGGRLRRGVESLCLDYLGPEHADVRGRGLMLGMEFVKPGAAREPAFRSMQRMVLACRREGLLLAASWNWDVLILLPSLNLTEDEVDEALARMRRAFKSVARAG